MSSNWRASQSLIFNRGPLEYAKLIYRNEGRKKRISFIKLITFWFVAPESNIKIKYEIRIIPLWKGEKKFKTKSIIPEIIILFLKIKPRASKKRAFSKVQ